MLRDRASSKKSLAILTVTRASGLCCGRSRMIGFSLSAAPNRDGPIIKLLRQLAWQRPEQGFGKLFRLLPRMGIVGTTNWSIAFIAA